MALSGATIAARYHYSTSRGQTAVTIKLLHLSLYGPALPHLCILSLYTRLSYYLPETMRYAGGKVRASPEKSSSPWVPLGVGIFFDSPSPFQPPNPALILTVFVQVSFESPGPLSLPPSRLVAAVSTCRCAYGLCLTWCPWIVSSPELKPYPTEMSMREADI